MVRLSCAPSHSKKDGKRDGDEVVLILAKNAADFVHDADHGEFFVVEAEGFAQGVHSEKKLLDESIANQADGGAMFRFRGSEVAASIDGCECRCRPWRACVRQG